MNKVLQGFAADQFGLVTRTQAISAGLSSDAIDWQLKSEQWIRVHRGVYRLASQRQSWSQSALAACLACESRVALSHATAGFVHELDGLKRTSDFHVLAPRELRVRLDGIVEHRTAAHFDVVQVRGLPVTNLARTVLDLASVLDAQAFERVLDSAQRRKSNLGPWLVYVMKQLGMRGPPGSALVKELLAVRLGITDSSLETDVTRALRKSNVVPWRHQFHVLDLHGRSIIRADFAWPQHRVVLHADSYGWHRDRDQFDRDRIQRNALRDGGWEELVVTSTCVEKDLWLEQLKRLLAKTDPQRRLQF